MAQLTVVKTVKGGALLQDSSGELFIRLDRVRLSYPFLGTASEDESDSGEKRKNWRVVAMLPKATHTAVKDLCKERIQALLKENEAKVPPDKWFLSNGNDKEDELMHEHFLVTAADSRNRPKIRDRKGNVIDDIGKIDDMFYGGCWGHVLIRPWFFAGKAKSSTKTFPKRVSANLVGVMFAEDDTPFGSGRVDESDAWDGLAKDASDDGMGDDGDDDSSL
jgi:hypothetical protein